MTTEPQPKALSILRAIQADNLLDVHTVDVARYPLPGRYVEGRVRVLLP